MIVGPRENAFQLICQQKQTQPKVRPQDEMVSESSLTFWGHVPHLWAYNQILNL